VNHRILELAEHCDFYVGNEHSDKSHEEQQRLFLEKFAELIVRECLEIVNRKEYSYHEADPLWETAELIKEHFGVES
jgi:hypothetical protein